MFGIEILDINNSGSLTAAFLRRLFVFDSTTTETTAREYNGEDVHITIYQEEVQIQQYPKHA